MPNSNTRNKDLKSAELLANLMDTQFKIPGSNFRFGLDPLIGLIPGFGDFAGFLVSGYMLLICAKNGASGFLLARMTLNILLDALIGAIPLLGDLFDFAYKANRRNLKLMQQHFVEGRHKGSAYKLVVPLLIILLIVIAALAWCSYKMFAWLMHQL